MLTEFHGNIAELWKQQHPTSVNTGSGRKHSEYAGKSGALKAVLEADRKHDLTLSEYAVCSSTLTIPKGIRQHQQLRY